jgi:DNA-binding CsgD family transcriptional regulator
MQAVVAASRGDAETAQSFADEIVRWAEPRGIMSLLAGARYAYGLMALARSDFEAAYQQIAKISPAGEIPVQVPFAAWAVLDLVEAAVRTDRRDDAVAHVHAAQQGNLVTTSPRMALLSAAAMALIALDEEAPALFDLALAGEDAERWPFERARVHLLYGERLRRMRAVNLARVHLGAAYDEFRRLGAPTWSDRAAAEARAAGMAPQDIDGCAHQLLTPQQLEIARLAAEGLTNQQIGERLYLSRRTVASHLYRMFPKLGITSRAALGRVLARDEI